MFDATQVTITVTDNSTGFRVPAKISDLSCAGKLGLVGTQERVALLGGSFEVKSSPGKGTRVIVKALV